MGVHGRVEWSYSSFLNMLKTSCIIVLACSWALAAAGTTRRTVHDTEPGMREGNVDDINFLLWTNSQSADDGYHLVKWTDDASISSAPLDASNPTVFIVHGFSDSGDNPGWIMETKNNILSLGEYNVISVDWGMLCHAPWYPTAVTRVPLVGERLAELLQRWVSEKGLDLSSVHLVGHSLGAHVSGRTGAVLNGTLGRITGLDPAGPEFYSQGPDHRIDASDAIFVDVIHTNGGGIIDGCIAIFEPLGHADFYPNGGDHQKGCTIGGEWIDLLTGGCSHQRATAYFAESVGSARFVARPCDAWANYGDCDCGPACANMGFGLDTSSASGSYFLETHTFKPYAMG